jgi:hypothetical protein
MNPPGGGRDILNLLFFAAGRVFVSIRDASRITRIGKRFAF